VDIDPGAEPIIEMPEGWDAQFGVVIDNRITEAFDTTPTIIEIPANDSVAISLYTGDEPENILDLANIGLELTIDENYSDEIEANYYRNLKPDLSINDIVNSYIEDNVDFLYPNLGRPLDTPTINLYNESVKSETWQEGDPIYQQIDDSVWCKLHPTGFTDLQAGVDWWASLDPSINTLCTTSFADLYPTPINNIKTDSYPQDPGVLYASDYSLYGPEVVFYLDNDQNGVVSIANLTRLAIVSADDTTSYERELDIENYDEINHNSLIASTDEYIKKDDGSTTQLSTIVQPSSVLITKPILIISTYRVPLTLKIGLSDETPEGYFIPAIETLVTSTGSRGANSQKLEALIEHNNNIPVLNQTIVY
ncbi:MAG: hypothetical protein PHU71_06105, partial [Candidatus Gracilibacteria bacterium]|nr:hypothetical protein [Candidatus Gracilibacteria bacterium]